jgi:tRNA pseudouridine55 synthase
VLDLEGKPYVFAFHKPVGPSTGQFLGAIKKSLLRPMPRIGHMGTLDPFASGLILVGVNAGTRLCDFVHQETQKTYRAEGILGIKTDTGDREGEVLQIDNTPYLNETISQFSKPFLQQIAMEFLGEYWQAPPIYSAAKFQGKKLCDWKRDHNVEIHKEKVRREIFLVEILAINFPNLSLRITASTGTYIRTFFEDFAARLGTLGHLTSLEREAIGAVSLTHAMNIDSWTALAEKNSPPSAVNLKNLLPYPVLELDALHAKKFQCGHKFHHPDFSSHGLFWVESQGENLGLGRIDSTDFVLAVAVGFQGIS